MRDNFRSKKFDTVVLIADANMKVAVALLTTLALSCASAQVIHQPAAHLPDVEHEGVAADLRLSPSLGAHLIFDVPKDALIGPEDRAIVRAAHSTSTTDENAADSDDEEHRWLVLLRCTLIACACASVMACGILPALLLPEGAGEALHQTSQFNASRRSATRNMRASCAVAHKHLDKLLAFSVGSLLGDVFLHVLPEAWASLPAGCCECQQCHTVGAYVIHDMPLSVHVVGLVNHRWSAPLFLGGEVLREDGGESAQGCRHHESCR